MEITKLSERKRKQLELQKVRGSSNEKAEETLTVSLPRSPSILGGLSDNTTTPTRKAVTNSPCKTRQVHDQRQQCVYLRRVVALCADVFIHFVLEFVNN